MKFVSVVGWCVLSSAAVSQAAIFESFEDVSQLPAEGWVFQNNSDEAGPVWLQGEPDWGISSYSGSENEYVLADYESTGASVGTISNWLLTPEIALNSNSVISFFTTTVSSPQWADRLQVRLSTNGASTNVGLSPTDVGDFSTLLLDINPSYDPAGYPSAWTKFEIPLSSLSTPVTGRVALRYFVESGGLNGDNSDTIGVDDFSVVPEPTAGVIAMGVATLGLLRRKK